ncbi:hypothetical protein [Nonomuraea sp. NEAU-A123]|uniref:hypothetical protein n=1 Tax=Nonomuraea sp. NEAU-A123 TaxID=2839649 RepID=UPI001BE432A4|nr:hypothetical protein [Nonomuraea sp. NEAU-A123]MBT2229112.1 hypothetical protein [Nonomuraea sp. NEAU-A123]
MRSQKLIPALALAAGLAVPAVLAAAPPAGATALATNCSVAFYDLDASAVDEVDGKDELRLEVGSRLFPNSWVNMQAGDDADPVDFDYASVNLSSSSSLAFNLREVQPPIVKAGFNLGTIIVDGSDCAGLSTGQYAIVGGIVSGTHDSYYEYNLRFKMTGL